MPYEVFRNNGQKVLVNVQEIKQKKPEETSPTAAQQGRIPHSMMHRISS